MEMPIIVVVDGRCVALYESKTAAIARLDEDFVKKGIYTGYDGEGRRLAFQLMRRRKSFCGLPIWSVTYLEIELAETQTTHKEECRAALIAYLADKIGCADHGKASLPDLISLAWDYSRLLRPPLIILEGDDVSMYRNLEDAILDLEPIDIADDIFIGYDSDGRLLSLRVVGPMKYCVKNTVHIDLAEITPTHATALRTLLLRCINRCRPSLDVSSASLEEIVQEALGFLEEK